MSRRIAASLIVCALVSGCSIRARFSIEPADASASDVGADGTALPDGSAEDGAATDVVGDVVADVQCGAGETACGGRCVDTQSDPSNCGACGTMCPMSTARVSFVCVTGQCGGECTTGTYVPSSVLGEPGTCEDRARQIAPISGSFLQGSVIEFRFTRTPDATHTLTLCSDAGCVMPPVTSRMLPGGSTSVSVTLSVGELGMFPAGVIFWRINGGAYQSPIWSVRLIPNPMPAPSIPAEERRSRAAFGAGTDFTGDGYSDIVVSATQAGRRHVLLLKASATAGAAPTYGGPYALPSAYRMGGIIARVGDVNGDGFSDIAVNEQEHAAVFVFRGGPMGFDPAPITIRRPADGVRFGSNITGGDLDGDGFSELIVADDDAPPARAGRVHLYWGSQNGPSAARTNALGPTGTPLAGAQFGVGLESACDIDGDGKHDLLVGAPNAPGGMAGGAPAVHMFRGGARPLSGVVTRRPMNETVFGTRVGCLGDLDGDGDHEWVTETRPSGMMEPLLAIYSGANTPGAISDIVRDRMAPLRRGPVLRFLPAYDMLQVMDGRGRPDLTFLSEAGGMLSVHTHINTDGNGNFGPVLGPVVLSTGLPLGAVINATVTHSAAGEPQLIFIIPSSTSSRVGILAPTVGGEFASPGATMMLANLPMGLTNVGEVLMR